MPSIRVRHTAAFLAIALAAGLTFGAVRASDAPAAVERRVDEIMSGMTLAEKIGQLSLVSNNPNFDDSILERGEAGGLLAFNNGRDIARAQAAARRSRSGIPLLVGLDILHGARTQFPVPLGEAGSFDPALAEDTARAAAREAAGIGINWTFAPMADLSRDARWGRTVEGFGEDPYLGRLFTAARVRGFRSGGLAATLKHFAGYGAPEGGRDYDNATISPLELANSYLPPFRAGIEAGADSVMAGLHALNTVPATANGGLLNDLLRKRLDFDGFVTSDWGAVEQLVDHGVASGPGDASRAAIAAGTDMDMASGFYAGHLADEIAAGRLPEAAVTQAARRVIRAKMRLGLSDRPFLDPGGTGEIARPGPEIRNLARRAARESIVLLRNEGMLPLAGQKRIALIGGMAASTADPVGPHAANWQPDDTVTVLDGLRRRGERDGATVTFAEGCDALCASADGFAEAEETARAADLVVAVLGEPVEMTGEGASRAHLRLPNRQAELLDRLVATGRPVILVLMASRPIELGPVINRLAGLLMAWYPGTEGGNALADLLFGDADPAAKLPVTWPRTVGQVPIHYDRLPSGRPHHPDNRYTLRYADELVTPLFPFGFGQTYSRFALSDLSVATPLVGRAGQLEVRVKLANVGARAGREVVQLYLRQPVAAVSRPVRSLKAFAKVALPPGGSEIVSLRVPAGEFGYYDEAGRYVLEPGAYEVHVGTSSDTVMSARFEVTP